jgi:F-type H+-transporting ATPase subunit b
MDQIIHAFGIDARLIIIQLVNFGLLMVVLGYFLYKPVLKLLADREAKIAQGLRDAEDAAKAKDEAGVEKQAILAAAHADATEVANRAKKVAEEKASEIVGNAEDKAAAVVADAEAKRELIKEQARKESEKELASVAILAAEKILKERA